MKKNFLALLLAAGMVFCDLPTTFMGDISVVRAKEAVTIEPVFDLCSSNEEENIGTGDFSVNVKINDPSIKNELDLEKKDYYVQLTADGKSLTDNIARATPYSFESRNYYGRYYNEYTNLESYTVLSVKEDWREFYPEADIDIISPNNGSPVGSYKVSLYEGSNVRQDSSGYQVSGDPVAVASFTVDEIILNGSDASKKNYYYYSKEGLIDSEYLYDLSEIIHSGTYVTGFKDEDTGTVYPLEENDDAMLKALGNGTVHTLSVQCAPLPAGQPREASLDKNGMLTFKADTDGYYFVLWSTDIETTTPYDSDEDEEEDDDAYVWTNELGNIVSSGDKNYDAATKVYTYKDLYENFYETIRYVGSVNDGYTDKYTESVKVVMVPEKKYVRGASHDGEYSLVSFIPSGEVLGAPNNAGWDTTNPKLARWDAVEGAAKYLVWINNINTGESEGFATTETSYDFTKWIGTQHGNFRFQVRALSGDINVKNHSRFCDESDVLGVTAAAKTAAEDIQTAADRLMADAEAAAATSGGSVEVSPELIDPELVNEVIGNLKTKYSTKESRQALTWAIEYDDDAYYNWIYLNEAYAAANKIDFDGIDAASDLAIPTVVWEYEGSVFSTPADSDVKLKLTNTASAPEIGDTYAKSVAIDLSLVDKDGKTIDKNGALDLPVSVTLQVPEKLAMRDIVVLHFAPGSTEPEKIVPVFDVLYGDEDDYGYYAAVRFTVNEMGTVVFAQLKDTGIKGSDEDTTPTSSDGTTPSNTSGSTGGGGSSAAAGTTTTKKNADGSTTTTNVVKNAAAGTTTTSESTTYKDGSKKVVKTVESKDGSKTVTETDTAADKSQKISELSVSAAGKGTLTTTTKDAKGKETSKTTYIVSGKKLTLSSAEGEKNVTIAATVTVAGTKYKITGVASGAFKGNKTIRSIELGKNVTTIGKNAFSNTSNLKSIVIKGNVKKIGKNAFKGINKKAVIKVSASKKNFKKIKKAIKASGIAKSVKIKRV